MRWSITLSSGLFLRQPMLDVLAPMRQAGFRHIQISAFRTHFDYYDRDLVARVRREMDRLGLRTTSLHAPFSDSTDLTLLKEGERLAAVAEVKVAIDALAALGGSTIVLHAGTADEEANKQVPQRLEQSVHSLTETHNYCQERGIVLAIEDMLAHLVGGRTEEIEWVLARLPRQGVGLCLDTGHSFLAQGLLERARRFGPRLLMVHAHDNRGKYDDHLPPGEGNIAWSQLLDTLAEVGFRGEIVLEIGGELDTTSLLQRAVKSARFLERCSGGKPYAVTWG